MTEMQVEKRNGKREPLDIEKLHKVVFFACEGVSGVSPSEIEIKSHIQFYNGIKTSDIQETLIKSAAELITEDTPNYQWVAGRLINYHLRKMVYNSYVPCHILDLVKRNVDRGFYDPELLASYSNDEWEEINGYIKHDRDENFSYAGMEQLRGKYLVQNRVTKEIFETPQMAYVLIGATLFSDYPKDERMKWVKDFYECVSTHEISLPTPIMAGVRTPQRQFSSCVLLETGDSLDSINATSSAIVKYVSQKAGIGIGAGRIRAIGSPIRSGDAYHTGVIPFYKHFQTAVKSCSQGGVRGGAATLFYPIWHLEVEELLVLKNNKGTEENRVRHLDYGVQFNKLMYERLLSGGDITLFSPSDVPGLYDSFFADQDEFIRLYENAERDPKIRRKVIPAIELFSSFMEERKGTGRVYLMNVDNANDHGSFDPTVAPIRQSNLCLEITLPTKPLNDINDEDGEIALCTLAANNWGVMKSPSDFERPCRVIVHALDALLSYQKYPVIAAQMSTLKYRPLGVGIINFAYWLAKHDSSYQNPNLELIHEWTEAWSYYLIKASVELAKEKGPCSAVLNTKYGQGQLPIDTYKRTVDELVTSEYKMDWESIREDLGKYGIRNATLMALMPSETSSQLANATNGIEPPRSLVSIKGSKDGILKQVVPGIHKLKNKYDLLWDQKSPEGYLKIVAVLQKFIDQSISANTSYNPANYEDEKIPMSELLRDLLMFYKYGGKTLYYFNTNDGQGEVDVDISETKKTTTELPPIDDAECDTCVI